MSKEKLPTAEEVLYEHGNKHPDSWNGFAYYHDSVLFSMESYKRSHTTPLQARIEELEGEINKSKIQDSPILERVLKLKEENERLREALDLVINIIEGGECYEILKSYHAYIKAKEALKEKEKQSNG